MCVKCSTDCQELRLTVLQQVPNGGNTIENNKLTNKPLNLEPNKSHCNWAAWDIYHPTDKINN